MALEGVILDVDGTLVLSNDAHAQAWVEAFAEYGYEVPFERVRSPLRYLQSYLIATREAGALKRA